MAPLLRNRGPALKCCFASITRVLATLADIVVVPRCLACRDRAERGAALCQGCRQGLEWIASSCPACGLPGRCSRCPARAWAFDAAWAPVAYAGPVPALVRAVKLRASRPAAELMAAAIVACAPEHMLSQSATLVPVPPDPWRSRVRGTDHALLLARSVARRTGQPVAQALVRSRTSRQAGSARGARLQRDLGMATRGVSISGPVVLVDDVHTTGATLHAAASALKHERSGRIAAMTFGRSI